MSCNYLFGENRTAWNTRVTVHSLKNQLFPGIFSPEILLLNVKSNSPVRLSLLQWTKHAWQNVRAYRHENGTHTLHKIFLNIIITWLTSVFNLSKFEGNAAVSPATNVASACLPILWISGAIFVATHKFSCFNNLPPHLVLRSLTVAHGQPCTTAFFWVSSRNFKSMFLYQHYVIVTPRTYRAKDKIGARISLLDLFSCIFHDFVFERGDVDWRSSTGIFLLLIFDFFLILPSFHVEAHLKWLLNTVKFSREKFGLRI